MKHNEHQDAALDTSRGTITIILNSNSGATAAKRPTADQIAEAFAAAGRLVSIVPAAGHELPLAARRTVDAGASIVVAAGGDGTVNAVAAAVAGTGTRMGVLPLGTLNHFAKDLGIPIDLDAAVRTIVNGSVASIDAGDVNGHLFVNNSSLGLYPRLVWEREQEQRRGRHKWHAFAVAVLRVWRRYRRVAVAVRDDAGARIVRTPFVFIGNNEYQLDGIHIGGRRRLDEGVLHLCMAPGLQRVDVVRGLLAAAVGRLEAMDRFESIRAGEFSIAARRQRLGVSLDGELTIMRTPLRYRIRPGVLQVMVPAPAGEGT